MLVLELRDNNDDRYGETSLNKADPVMGILIQRGEKSRVREVFVGATAERVLASAQRHFGKVDEVRDVRS